MQNKKNDEVVYDLFSKDENDTSAKYRKKTRKKYSKGAQRRKFLFYVMAISSIIYIVWRAIFTLPVDQGILTLIFGILLFSSELIAVIESILNQNAYDDSVLPEMPVVPHELYPDVDVFIATHTEEVELLYKTVNSCKFLKYPDKNKVHIYICDDTNRSEVRKLADDLGVGYITIINNKHAKAGNLNNAISKTNSPLIVTLDADMIPKSEFLMKTVPYFFLPKVKRNKDGSFTMKTKSEIDPSEKIGFVQTPQTFYNPDMFQFNLFAEKNIPNEQDYFFREVNVGKNATNSPIYAGSNTVISREALEEVGGIRTGTITEDFATGMDIQAKGYMCFAIPDPLVSGLSPTTIESLIKQRVRWGRGCVQTLFKPEFFFAKIPLASKLSYFACLLYWTAFFRRTIYIFAPILYAVFGIVVVNLDIYQYLLIGFPAYVIYNLSLRRLSRGKIDFRWSNTIDTILAPYLFLPILFEAFGVRLKKFNVTQKSFNTSKNSEFSYAIPNIIFFVSGCIGIVFLINSIIFEKQYFNVIILYWLALNSYFLLMSIIFMTGRVNYRDSERFEASLPVEVIEGDHVLRAVVNDISETGLSITLKHPIFFNYDDHLIIKLTDRNYNVTMNTKIVHTHFVDETTCKYNLFISEIDEENRSNYFAFIYDRDFVFATSIKTSGLGDLIRFIRSKSKKSITSNRVLPRVTLDKKFVTTNDTTFFVFDFNGRYLTASSNSATLEFYITDDILVKANFVRDIDKDRTLFEVEDWVSVATKLREKHLNIFAIV